MIRQNRPFSWDKSWKDPAEWSTIKLAGIDNVLSVVFIATDTDESKWCAKALKTRCENEGLQSTVRVAEGLALSGATSASFSAGLRKFVSELAFQIQLARDSQEEVRLSVTAGTKGQVAVSFQLASMMRVPVVYVHELMQELVALPPVPSSWDLDFFSKTYKFWDMFDDDFITYEESRRVLEQFEETVSRQLEELTEVHDGQVWLNSTGHAYLLACQSEASRRQEEMPIMFSETAIVQLKSLPRSSERGAKAVKLMTKAANYHQLVPGSFKLGAKKGTKIRFCPDGSRKANEHVAVFVEDGILHVCEFFFTKDDRDRELRQGQVQIEDFSGFRKFTLGLACKEMPA